MSITDYKITTWNNPIVNEADRPQRSASSMKEVFDSNSNQLRTALNNLIDALAQGGASDIGAAVEGMEGNTIENILAELKSLIDSAGEDLDDLKAAVLPEGDGSLFLANNGEWKLPSVGAAANGLPAGGAVGDIFVKKSLTVYDGEWKSPANLGFMMASTYDTDDDGIVDKAEDADKLGGKLPEEYQGTIKTATATLLLTEWSGAQAPYTYTLNVTGVTASSIGGLRIAQTATDEQFEAWGAAQPRITAQTANTIVISIMGDVPVVNIPVEVWYA